MKLTDLLTNKHAKSISMFSLRGEPSSFMEELKETVTREAKKSFSWYWLENAEQAEKIIAEAMELLNEPYRTYKTLKESTVSTRGLDRAWNTLLWNTIAMLVSNKGEDWFVAAKDEFDNFTRSTGRKAYEIGKNWAVGEAQNFVRDELQLYSLFVESEGELDLLHTCNESVRQDAGLHAAIYGAAIDVLNKNPLATNIEIWAAMDEAAKKYAATSLIPRLRQELPLGTKKD